MKRGADNRPSLFKTFYFESFAEATAFVASLPLLGAESAALIEAKVVETKVRFRIRPHPQTGKAGARTILAELESLRRSGR